MVVLLDTTFGASVLAEFALAVCATANGVFYRLLATTMMTVVMVVGLVFAFFTHLVVARSFDQFAGFWLHLSYECCA